MGWHSALEDWDSVGSVDLGRGVLELTKKECEENNPSEKAYSMEQTVLSVCSLLLGPAKMVSSIRLALGSR